MEQKDDNLRERLLARLPQPENLAAYREETASFLARHERALFSEKFTAVALELLGLALWVTTNSTWGPRLNTDGTILFDSFAALLFLTGIGFALSYRVDRSKVDILKEVKQVQLQLLEFQASFQKDGDHRP
jgi:hypothetical protein